MIWGNNYTDSSGLVLLPWKITVRGVYALGVHVQLGGVEVCVCVGGGGGVCPRTVFIKGST